MKTIAAILSVLLMLGMVGCGGQTAQASAPESPSVTAAPSNVPPSSSVDEPAAAVSESLPLPDEWVGEYQSPDGDKLNIDSPTMVRYGGEQLLIEHFSTFAFGYNKAGHYVQLKYSSEKNDKQQTVHTIQVVVSDVTQTPPVTLVEYVNYTRLEGEPVEAQLPPHSSGSSSAAPPASTPEKHPLEGSFTGHYTYNGPVESYNLTVGLNIFTDKGNLYAHYSEDGEGYGTNAPYDWPPSLGPASGITGNTLSFVAVKLVNGQFGPSDQPFADVSVTFNGDSAQLTISHHVDGTAYNVALTRSK